MTTEQSTPLVDGVQCHRAGTQGYDRATTPLNSFVTQRPALVAVPTDADQVAACVRYAAEHGLTVVPQATGHGAAAELDQGVLLVDTSGLASIHIDADARSATVGAGCTWGAVDAAAAEHGLLGRAGSAPTVGVTGFTFGAGAGWLVRAGGLASGSLTAVDYVDGRGEIHRAGDDAERDVDRDVIWACRGGGGVGLAVVLEFGLLPVQDLWAGTCCGRSGRWTPSSPPGSKVSATTPADRPPASPCCKRRRAPRCPVSCTDTRSCTWPWLPPPARTTRGRCVTR